VAFILDDVFRYPYAEIATIVARSPQACRQKWSPTAAGW